MAMPVVRTGGVPNKPTTSARFPARRFMQADSGGILVAVSFHHAWLPQRRLTDIEMTVALFFSSLVNSNKVAKASNRVLLYSRCSNAPIASVRGIAGGFR